MKVKGIKKHNCSNINFYSICLLLLLVSHNLTAQKYENKWVISFGINAVDLFPTGTKESAQYEPQGKLFEDFFNISDHWNFGGPSFSISRLIFSGFSIGAEMSLNNIKKINGHDNIDYPYYAGNIYLKKIFNSNKRLRPFVKLGYGVSGIDRGLFGGGGLMFSQYFSETIDQGLGIQIALSKNLGFEISSSLNIATEKTGINHFKHQFGLYFGLGRNDRDNDGIINRKDKCPDASGTSELFGCPDSDGDGIIDIEDACPNEFGTIENNGCIISNNTNIDSGIISDTISSVSSKTEITEKNTEQEVQENNSEIKEYQSSELVIYFPASKSIILGKKAYDMLLEIRNFLDSNLEKYVVIEGHSSSDGNKEFNQFLSEKRAESVKEYLINLGIPANRIKTKGYGSDKPLFVENSFENRILNRRVEVRFE